MNNVYAGWTLDPSWAGTSSGLLFRTHPELWNWAWLTHPELDQWAGKQRAEGYNLPCAHTMMHALDYKTWEHLVQPPDVFMDYFMSIDDGNLALVDDLPHGYQRIMRKRADDAMRRMFPKLSNNVVYVDFKERRLCAPV